MKPLTIFVGPSNTGKSYMAMAVYAVVKAFQGDNLVPIRHYFFGGAMYTNKGLLGRWDVPSEDSDVGKAVWKWARQLDEDGLDPQQFTVSSLPENVQLALEGSTVQELARVRSNATSHLRQVHGEPAGFVNRGAQPEDFRLTIHRDEPLLNMDIPLMDDGNADFEFDISKTEVTPSPLALLHYRPRANEELLDVYYEVMSSWVDSVAERVLAGVPNESYYLPAARSGIVQGHKVLVAEIVRQSVRTGQQGSRIPTLPGITTEFPGQSHKS